MSHFPSVRRHLGDDAPVHQCGPLTPIERELVDAHDGELAAISREHFPHHRLALTRAACDLLLAHAETDDLVGLWHRVLLMAHGCPVRRFAGGHTFEIALGEDQSPRRHHLLIRFHSGPLGEPCATVMLPDEV